MIYIYSPHKGKQWIALQKQFVDENTPQEHYLFQYMVPRKRMHVAALNTILELVSLKGRSGDLIVIVDSDAFPISPDWIAKVEDYLSDKWKNEFVAIQRLENPRSYKEIAHPCFCTWHKGTHISFDEVVRNPYIVGYDNRTWKKLWRTNDRELHQLLYGVYDNMVYHHGAGSRDVKGQGFFRSGLPYGEYFFNDPKRFIAYLRGSNDSEYFDMLFRAKQAFS